MKSNIKLFVAISLSIILGLTAGFLIFGGETKKVEQSFTNTSEESVVHSEQIWTCSMHPQVRQNEPGLCPICEMDLIPLESNTSNDPLVLQMTEEATKLANIQTTSIGSANLSEGIIIPLSGKVQADERRASSQVAHLPGRIEKLYVSFTGENVNKGQKLASIYSPDLIAAQRELIEAQKLKELNPGLLKAARNKLRFWKLGEDFISSIEEHGEIQETFTLFANDSGVVVNRRVSVGDYVNKGGVLFDLVNLGKVWVLFDAYEEDLVSIKINDWITFTTPSAPNQKFKSKITFIDPVINPNTRVASLRTELDNKNRLLKPEMFVNGLLKKRKMNNSILAVPKSAVLWTGKRSVVYVKLQDVEIPSFQFREVELGESMGSNYQILSGLEDGEEVVTYGNFTIDAAAQLNNQASMMNRNVELKKEGPNDIPNFRESTPESFKKQLGTLTSSYMTLKNAFVATDARLALEAVNNFSKSLDLVDMELVKGEGHLFWMDQLAALKSHGQKIIETNDIEVQRKQFGFLSTAMILTLEAFGTSGEHVYVQFCPMAFDNQGADWLSKEKPIQNPYFGDKMMKCGVVKKDLADVSVKQSHSSAQNQINHNH